MRRRLLRKCWFALAILIILAAVIFSLVRALTPWAAQYKTDVETRLSTLLGQTVTIQTMETSWYWFEPVLKLTHVSITDSNAHNLNLEQLLVGIDLAKSLWHWTVEPGILYLDGVNLTVHQTESGWRLDGLNPPKEALPALTQEAWLPVAGWLLAQEKIILKRVTVRTLLLDGTQLPVTAIQLTATNRSGRYRLRGSAKLAQAIPTQLMLLADLQLDLSTWRKTKGQIWLSVEDWMPAQWQTLFPASALQLTGGQGDFRLWLNVMQGEIKRAQTQVQFNHLAWTNPSAAHHLQRVEGNLAWARGPEGWQLSGDAIEIHTAGVSWPENQLQIEYNALQDSYRLFVKTIPLELALRDNHWPEPLQSLIACHPHGELKNTQIEIRQKELAHVLTRFRRLGWDSSVHFPGVEPLSGVLEWKPDEGRLEFDADNLHIVPQQRPPVILTQLNGALRWARQEQNWLIQLERFIVSHPDFKISAQGDFEKPPVLMEGRVDLTMKLSATNAQQWMTYLPAGYLKPKLEDWLKHNIKQIPQFNGQVKVQGALADFPFDNQPGEFSVTARVRDAELMITPQWPLNRQLDAWLQLDRRNLSIDVVQAQLEQLSLKQTNIKLDDIGLDKETLLLRTQVKAPAKNMMQYIAKTPLHDSLSRLNALDIQGDLGVDLSLEIPLYPENDDILAQGTLTFDNNQLLVHHAAQRIELNALSGTLQFNEQGITGSALQGILFGEPIQLDIQSIHQGVPRTEIRLQSKTSVESLSKQINLYTLSKASGTTAIRGVLTLTDDPQAFDRIQLESTLEGIAIDLPAPFGKQPKEKTPLAVTLSFHPEKAPKIDFDYKNRLSGALRFQKKQQNTVFYNAQIQLGGGEAKETDKPGLYVSGRLPVLDLSPWQAEFKHNGKPATPQWKEYFKEANVSFGRLKAWGNEYQDITLGLRQSSEPDTWDIQVKNAMAQANLRYQTVTNTLSGDFQYLRLPDSFFTAGQGKSNAALTRIKPDSIPHLDLAVEQLKVGAIDLGHLLLKTTSTPDVWQINSCVMQSSLYKMNAKGKWTVTGQSSNTQMTAELNLTDLAGNLKNLDISPVVEARRGTIQLDGQWPGGPQAFSLSRLNGSMSIVLKKGRITRLGPETEEKLGLGKLLSILSLQTIPRRLMLDFSDLASPGYSFDIFSGHFKMNQGIMSTQDSYIDGPVAYVAMQGDLDLAKRLYNLDLQVSPHITASLPIVATIAGGPVVGVAAWLAGQVINQGMQKISSYTYNITGPWLEPVVRQGNIVKKSN